MPRGVTPAIDPAIRQALRARADAALEQYCEYLGGVRRRSEHTLRNYRNDLGAFFAFLAEGGVEFDQAGRGHGRAFLGHARDADVAPASLKRQATTVRAFYGWLDREGMLPPAQPGDSILMLRYPKAPKRLPHFLSTDEAQALVDAPSTETTRGMRDHALLELLYGAGLRVSELAGIDTRDLDLANRQVRVTGKGERTRICLYGEPAHDALVTYIERARPTMVHGAQPALWIGREGARLSVRAIQEIVRRSGVAAAIRSRVHPHLLRHTFATHMLDGNADLRVVQALLGHASADTTQIYTAVTKSRQAGIVANAMSRAREAERRDTG
jgi:site-specific recombinase XerD